ncbi:MerR family transcriptional regulator [Desertihabitans aurantiacus]|uniref:MerR family transcriptional regulator n=1 Tax=Desertihabitans aurantiacus TaxID=2282477 RepID=UPI000DF7DE6D|nr:MerR family transcriptional regulator [Desertihabitans aurantiacus]
MRSSELAALAGVTVRTLRHYHQIGLLEEPRRTAGGYRSYDVGHLVRILRITRLTALGVPLAVLPEVLDDPEAAESLLDELDQQAAAEIERLTTRRAVIAALRHHRGMPDLPPVLAELGVDLRASAEAVPELARYEREQLVLLAHVLGETDFATVARSLAPLMVGDPAATELVRRLSRVDQDTSEAEVERLAGDLADHYRPLLARLGDLPAVTDPAQLLTAHLQQSYNERQQQVNERFVELLHLPDAVDEDLPTD